MADDKKRDDIAIPISERETDRFVPRGPPSPSMGASSKNSLISSTNQGPISVISYCLSSLLMTTTNKYVLSGLDYNMNFLLLAVQSVTCVIAIESAKKSGWITYRDFKIEEARKWFPISLLLIGMIYTGTWAIKYLSIPVYTIFKNLTIILIAYGEVLWFGGSVSPLTLFSFGLMVFSSIIAAWADIQHALSAHVGEAVHQEISTLNAGYIWMFANCICNATYVLSMKKRIKLIGFADFDTMYYNNLLTIPVLLICSVVLEDWSATNLDKNFPAEHRRGILTAMFISGLSSVFISYTSAWCIRVTSSTTYSMAGALNKLPVAICGLVFFDAPVTFGSVSAIAVGFISGIVYSYAKIKDSASKTVRSILPTSSRGLVSASSQSEKEALRG